MQALGLMKNRSCTTPNNEDILIHLATENAYKAQDYQLIVVVEACILNKITN